MIDFSPVVWEELQSILARTMNPYSRAMLQTDTKLYWISDQHATGDGLFILLTEPSAGFEAAYEATGRRRQR
jgi:hypothetical protein